MRATRKAIRCAIGRFNGGFGVADLLCSWSSLDAANASVPPPSESSKWMSKRDATCLPLPNPGFSCPRPEYELEASSVEKS